MISSRRVIRPDSSDTAMKSQDKGVVIGGEIN